MSNNNKEQFRLLDISSDLESDELHFDITPVKKKRIHRKAKPRLSIHQNGIIPTAKSRTADAVVIIIMAIALFWLLTLTWLTAALHDHISRLDAALETVNSNGGSLQSLLEKSEAVANEAKANVSDVANKLSALSLAHEALKSNVNDVGARLNTLNDTVRDLKGRIEDLSTAVHGLEASVTNATHVDEKLEYFNKSINALNSLRERVHILEKHLNNYTSKVENIQNEHSALIANVTTNTNVTTSTTSIPVASIGVPQVEATSTAPPPQKPSVTQ